MLHGTARVRGCPRRQPRGDPGGAVWPSMGVVRNRLDHERSALLSRLLRLSKIRASSVCVLAPSSPVR